MLSGGVQRHIELLVFLQHFCTRLQQEGHGRQTQAALVGIFALGMTEFFEFSDICFIKLRNGWHVQPVAMHIERSDLVQLGHWNCFDFSKLTEIYIRHGRYARATGGCSRRWRLQPRFDKPMQIFLLNATLGTASGNLRQINTQFTGQFAHCRTCVDFTVTNGLFNNRVCPGSCRSRCGCSL